MVATASVISEIIGFENNNAVLYRHGSIPIEEIEKIIGKVEIKKVDTYFEVKTSLF